MRGTAEPLTVLPDPDPVGTALGSEDLRKRMEAFALRLVKSPNRVLKAEELVSEAFVRIVGRKAEYDPARASVQTWAMSFINVIARERIRKSEIQRRRHLSEDELKHACTGEPTPDSNAVRREEWNRIVAAVDRFSAAERELFELRHRDGRSCREIAARLKKTHADIRVKLSRLKGKIVSELGIAAEVRS